MWLQSGHHGCGLLRELPVVVCLSHSRRDIPDGFKQAMVVEQ